MKIGIGLPNQVRDVRAAVIPEWARRSEQAGFSSLGTLGRIAYPGVMDTVALAAAAGATSTIGLLTTVLLGPVWPSVILAKEAASIDAVSGGRFTLGLGLGGRPDDFVVEGLGPRGTGKRLDADIEMFRRVWAGENVPGSDRAAVPAGSRQVPMLFGGMAQASFNRVARAGDGCVGATVPAPMVAPVFESVRAAWREAGREGSPRLVAIAYFAFGDIDAARANVYDYYIALGDETADLGAAGVSAGADAVRATIDSFAEIGADELIFHPALDGLDEMARLAEVAL